MERGARTAARKPAGPGRGAGPELVSTQARYEPVNVVIPCYNYGRFLGECVSSVLDDQPGMDVRVLIIDDASQDDSAEIARKLAAADDRDRGVGFIPTTGVTSQRTTKACWSGRTVITAC